jgi:four helix bundle protein
MVHTYKDLIVWQKSMDLAKHVYAESKKLPKEELFGLVNQMRRAAVSIPSNIAEGSRRGTTKDLVQFLRIADGSLGELETQLLLAENVYQRPLFNASKALVPEIQKMLAVLIKRLRTSTNH